MFVVRDIFHCKPGKAKELIERFKSVMPGIETADGFRNNRILVDFVADYWTVVLESDVESLEQFELHMNEFNQRPGVKEKMAGYMELVDHGHREIFRIA